MLLYRSLPVFIGPLPEGVMYLLAVGIALLLMRYLEIGFMAGVSWWWVAVPFGLTVAWWTWADTTGYTKRKEVEKMDRKKKERIDKQRAALGIRTRKR
jgi:small Trp-rich protein